MESSGATAKLLVAGTVPQLRGLIDRRHRASKAPRVVRVKLVVRWRWKMRVSGRGQPRTSTLERARGADLILVLEPR
jgi:hypothetical protein